MTTVRFVTESVVDGSMSVGGENDAEMVLHSRLGGLRVTLLVPLEAVRRFVKLNAPDSPCADTPSLASEVGPFDVVAAINKARAILADAFSGPCAPPPDHAIIADLRATFDALPEVGEMRPSLDVESDRAALDALENTLGIARTAPLTKGHPGTYTPHPQPDEPRALTCPACNAPAPAQLAGYTLFCERVEGHTTGDHRATAEDLKCSWDDDGNFHAHRVKP